MRPTRIARDTVNPLLASALMSKSSPIACRM
jgi:hypothetical protein